MQRPQRSTAGEPQNITATKGRHKLFAMGDTDVKELQPLIETSNIETDIPDPKQHELDQAPTENTTEHKSNGESQNCSSLNIRALTALALVLVCVTGSSIFSQLGGGKTNIFQVNTIRYGLSTGIALVRAILRRKSLWLEKRHICKTLVSGLCNFLTMCGLYFCQTFAPIGNTQAMFVVLYILISTIIDFIQGKIQLWGTVSSATSILGLFLLAQPWNEVTENASIHIVPCDYWEGKAYFNLNYSGTNRHIITTTNHDNVSNFKEDHYTNYTRDTGSFFIYIDGIKHNISLNPLLLGYIVDIMAAVSVAICAYTAKDLREQVNPEALTFWLSVFEGLLSIIMTVIWSELNSVPLYQLPSGSLCLGFTLIFGFFLGIYYSVWVLSVGYFNISKMALCDVATIVLLYICQRTFLKPFHPGKANLCEAFGVVVICCGLLIIPLHECVRKK